MQFRKLALGVLAGTAIFGGAFFATNEEARNDIRNYFEENVVQRIEQTVQHNILDKVKESNAIGISTEEIQLYKDRDLHEPVGIMEKGEVFEKLGYDKDAHKIVVNGMEYWIPDGSPWLYFSQKNFDEYYRGDALRFLLDTLEKGRGTTDDGNAFEALRKLGDESVIEELIRIYEEVEGGKAWYDMAYLAAVAELDRSHRYFNFLFSELRETWNCPETHGPPSAPSSICKIEDAKDILTSYASSDEEMAIISDFFYRRVREIPECNAGYEEAVHGLFELYKKGSNHAKNYIKLASDAGHLMDEDLECFTIFY